MSLSMSQNQARHRNTPVRSAPVYATPEHSGRVHDVTPFPGTRSRVLIVDDEETIRLALARFLRSRGHDVETAGNGSAALERLREAAGKGIPFAAMLCDVRMPGMMGVELVQRAIEVERDLAVMMLTAVNDAPTATGALSNGAMDYLTKPVELADLHAALERILARRAREMEQREMDRRIREEVALRTAELEHEKAALRTLTVGIVETLINAQEAKDLHLRGHSQRVSDLGAAVAQELGLEPAVVEDIRLAGRLHDVGKIGVREEVLNKPGRLTPAEFEHIKGHVQIGVEILAPLRHIIGTALQYVHDHHEQVGGGGYPRGLRGEEISLGGRILCACDVFDALTSTRSYREPLTAEAALELIGNQAGDLVDSDVFDALRTVVTRMRAEVVPG